MPTVNHDILVDSKRIPQPPLLRNEKVKRDRVRRQSSKKQILRKKRGNSLNLKNIKRRVEMLDAVSTELYPSAAASGARQQQKDPKNNKKH
jgi:hypothetical protein